MPCRDSIESDKAFAQICANPRKPRKGGDAGRAGQTRRRGTVREAARARIRSADPQIDGVAQERVGKRLLRVIVQCVVRVITGRQGVSEGTAHCSARCSGTKRPAVEGNAVPVGDLVKDSGNQDPMWARVQEGVSERVGCIVRTMGGPEQGDCRAPGPEVFGAGLAKPT